METSDRVDDLAAALALAQAEIQAPPRNRTVNVRMREGKGTYTFSYAELSTIIEAIRAPLTKNGLWFVQTWERTDGEHLLTTRITHPSGQWIEMTAPIMGAHDEITPQEFGSALTYARRYQLCSILGIAAETDDDGNAASGNEVEDVKAGPKMGLNVLVADVPFDDDVAKPKNIANPDYWGIWGKAFKRKVEEGSPEAAEMQLKMAQISLKEMKKDDPELFRKLQEAMIGVYPDGLITKGK